MACSKVEQVGTRILSLRRSDDVVLVAIDGLGGAGKSTLAKQLSTSIGTSVIEGDDFYRVMSDAERRALQPEEGTKRNFDWQRMRDQALHPLRRGEPANYERYDWTHHRLGPAVQVEPNGIVVVEGVGSFRPELRSLYHFSIFVDTPREVCLQRLRQRGNSQYWITRWAAAEDWYVEQTRPAEAVDLVVRGVD